MQSITIQRLKRHTLWLSILGHLILLLMLTTVLLLSPRDKMPESSPSQSIPSYLSPSPVAPPAPEQPTPAPAAPTVTEPKPEPEPKQAAAAKPVETAKNGILKSVAKQPDQVKAAPKPKASRRNQPVTFAKDDIPEDITNPRDQEPLHLIGESKIIKPLVKILARALSRHLFYPRVAADLNLRGVVLVGFTLHPEGYVTGAKVVKSSGAGLLDDAARDAVGAMSPVGDVHEYVAAPEFLVVGIIFG